LLLGGGGGGGSAYGLAVVVLVGLERHLGLQLPQEQLTPLLSVLVVLVVSA
jgi:4-diphosphocytidyl-2C-methyl-D-erythritol kinase